MKQNITLSLDTELLRQAKLVAAKRKLSLSKLLAEELAEQVTQTRQHEQAKQQALAWLDKKFPLGGLGIKDRDTFTSPTRSTPDDCLAGGPGANGTCVQTLGSADR